MRAPIFAANWKMNKYVRELSDFFEKFKSSLNDAPLKVGEAFEVIIAPSPTHLTECVKYIQQTQIRMGAQNCGLAKFGAYTGETSPAVLKEIGAEWVIVGHSERRHVFKEDDYLILSRVRAALQEGLKVIFCVGEILQDRKAGKTFNTIEKQLSILKEGQIQTQDLKNLVIAYEPVWAIGTGENATPQQAQEIHRFIRNWVQEKFSSEEAQKLRILYGGSVKVENATQIMSQPDVDGLLVGTASLDPTVFAGVVKNGLKPLTQEKNT